MWKLLTLLSIIQLTFAWPQHHQQPRGHHYYAIPASSSLASAYRRYIPENKCHDSETGRELYIGDFFTRPGQCVRVQCLGTLQIWEDRCQVPKLVGNCSSLPVANEFLDYPRCCPLYECHSFRSSKNNEIETRQTYDHMGNLIREHITQRILVILDANMINNEPVNAQFYIS